MSRGPAFASRAALSLSGDDCIASFYNSLLHYVFPRLHCILGPTRDGKAPGNVYSLLYHVFSRFHCIFRPARDDGKALADVHNSLSHHVPSRVHCIFTPAVRCLLFLRFRNTCLLFPAGGDFTTFLGQLETVRGLLTEGRQRAGYIYRTRLHNYLLYVPAV